MKNQIILLLSAFLILCTTSYGQEVWSLEKCILHSQDASIAVNQAEILVDQAEIELNQSRQNRLPNLSGSANSNWNFGRTIDPTSNEFVTETFFSNNFSLNAGVSLFEGFRINNRIKQSKLDLEATRNETEQTRRNIALQVASNYLNVLFAKENIEVSRGQLALNRQQLEQTQKQINAGTLAESERLNLEAQVAQSEQALIVSENNLDISILQLKQVLRLDPGYNLDVEAPEGISIETDPDMISFEEAYTMALKNRPDLVGQDLRVQSADIGIKLAKGSLYPSIRIGGSLGSAYSNQARQIVGEETVDFTNRVTINSPDPNFPFTDLPLDITTEGQVPITNKPSYTTQLDNNLSYGFGVGVSIPIYNNGATRNNIQRAKLNAENQELQYDQLLENLPLVLSSPFRAPHLTISHAGLPRKNLRPLKKRLKPKNWLMTILPSNLI